jgi:hypothetical protein
MTSQSAGILLGGILPAIAFGISGVFSKASTQAGIGLGLYLMIAGLAVTACGIIIFLLLPDTTLSARSGIHAFLMGFLWALGAAGVAFALLKFQIPLGKLVPLYNANTLVAVLFALWVFAEWKQVKTVQLLIGSVLIVVGAVTVSKA